MALGEALLQCAIAVAVVPAALQLIALGRILVGRIGYPYDVHFVDGSSLLHAHRLLHGLRIYPKIDAHSGFIGNPYPPFLYVVLGALGSVFGLDYATGRVVAIAATGIAAALLARDVHLGFQGLPLRWAWTLATLGAIAAGFPFTGAWYDAAMTDPLALSLTVVAARMLLSESGAIGWPRLLFAAALLTAVVFTKQTYAALSVWPIALLCRSSLKKGLIMTAIFAASTLFVFFALQWATDGRFFDYVVVQPLHHPFVPRRIADGIGTVFGFAPYIPIALGGALILIVKRRASQPTLLWTGLLALAFPVALIGYAKAAGNENNFMPIVVLAPAAALMTLADASRLVESSRRPALLAAVALLAGAYLQLRSYSAAPFVANDKRRAAAAAVNRFISGLDGDVLIPSRPFLAIRNRAFVEQVHIAGWYDAVLSGRPVSFFDFIARQRPRHILLSDQEPAVMVEAMARDYFLKGPMPIETWPARMLETELANDEPTIADYPDYPGQLKWILERNAPEPADSHCLFEFESERYEGWTAFGSAFGAGPTPIDAREGKLFFAAQGTVVGVVGRRFASSYAPLEGDRALGGLSSASFLLDKRYLSLRVAGSRSGRARVELRVDGQLRKAAHGRGNDYLERIQWDVARDVGQKAELVVIDDDPDGHVALDHVCLAAELQQ